MDHASGGVDTYTTGYAPEPPALQPSCLPLVQAIVPAIMSLRPRFAVAARRCSGGDDAPKGRSEA